MTTTLILLKPRWSLLLLHAPEKRSVTIELGQGFGRCVNFSAHLRTRKE